MSRALFYYGLPAECLPWSGNREASDKAYKYLGILLREEAAAGCLLYTTNLRTESDLIFAEKVLQMRQAIPAIELHVSAPFTLRDQHAQRRDALLEQAASAALGREDPSSDTAFLVNDTALAKKAGIFVSPLEQEPRSAMSVMLARMTMEHGARIIYFSHLGIQRLKPQQVGGGDLP